VHAVELRCEELLGSDTATALPVLVAKLKLLRALDLSALLAPAYGAYGAGQPPPAASSGDRKRKPGAGGDWDALKKTEKYPNHISLL
jgi:hypothetical protein